MIFRKTRARVDLLEIDLQNLADDLAEQQTRHEKEWDALRSEMMEELKQQEFRHRLDILHRVMNAKLKRWPTEFSAVSGKPIAWRHGVLENRAIAFGEGAWYAIGNVAENAVGPLEVVLITPEQYAHIEDAS